MREKNLAKTEGILVEKKMLLGGVFKIRVIWKEKGERCNAWKEGKNNEIRDGKREKEIYSKKRKYKRERRKDRQEKEEKGGIEGGEEEMRRKGMKGDRKGGGRRGEKKH